MEEEEDFLDEMIAEATLQDPDYPRKLEEAVQRLERRHTLTIARRAARVSQATIAAYMGESRSFVSRFELGDEYVTDEVLDRYAAALTKAQGGHALRATS